MSYFGRLWRWINRQAGWLFLVGLGAVLLLNWRRWQQDSALAHQRGEYHPEPIVLQNTPLVSILVAAWNEAEMIARHIESFLQLRYPNKELIICAGGEDDTLVIAMWYSSAEVIVLEQGPGEGKQQALQRCLEHAHGEIIFLTDADCILNDDAFERTLAPIINESETAVTGRFAPYQRQRQNTFVITQWYIDNYARSHSSAYIEGLIGGNAALLRSALERMGGFAVSVRAGTDYYLALKLILSGVRIRYVHTSVVETAYNTGLLPYIQQRSRWLRNVLLHGYALGFQHHVRAALTRSVAGAAMVIWPLTVPITGRLGTAIWLVALVHGVLSRFRYIRFGEITLAQPQHSSPYLLAPLYLLLDQVMLGYVLLEILLPARRWKW